MKWYIQYLTRAHWSAKDSISHRAYRLLSKYPSPAAYRSVASAPLLQCEFSNILFITVHVFTHAGS